MWKCMPLRLINLKQSYIHYTANKKKNPLKNVEIASISNRVNKKKNVRKFMFQRGTFTVILFLKQQVAVSYISKKT